MNAIVLSIGDELISGLTLNTNAPWLSQQLAAIGVSAIVHLTVGDNLQAIASAIRQSCDYLEVASSDIAATSNLLLITGGLGPTEDDLTRPALADALNEKLVEDPDAVLQIENLFKRMNRRMSASNRLQALRPHSAEIIENIAGTAPGLHARKHNSDIFVMPGVPREMREMFTRSILPKIRARLGDAATITVVTKINTFGLGESIVGERIKDLMSRNPEPGAPKIGTTVADGIVSVRIYATGAPDAVQSITAKARAEILSRFDAGLVFGEGDESLQSAVGKLLKENHYTVATAESCTGGLLAELFTDIPGSSAYFLRGWVTYANVAKHDELHVSPELIEKYGAVSQEVARAMAAGARRFAESDYALATTGIAGPDGGTPDKPVGTVWIALASPDIGGENNTDGSHIDTCKFTFPGDRAAVRLRTAQMALALLRWKILGLKPPA